MVLGKSTEITQQVSVCGALQAQEKSDVAKKIESGETCLLTPVLNSSLVF